MTVAELGQRISAPELAEWQIYDAVEGLPDARADWRAGIQAALLANIHRKKGTPPFRPRDFMPRRFDDPGRPRPPRQPLSTLRDYLEERARKDARPAP
jgi:hypothetical protein